MSQLLPFMLFAFVASITPGPTNVLVLGSSARYGVAATLPLVLGACFGAAAIVVAVGLGLGELLQQHPRLQWAMAWFGVLWLSYLAWRIFTSPPAALDGSDVQPGEHRLGLFAGAALQLVNPKTWMMALAVVSIFATPGPGQAMRVSLLAAIFLAISLPCLGCWALLGRGAARVFTSVRAMTRFNQAMALLLLLSAWLGAPL
ncbi:LysE family translocator [Phytopseudomonas daroniae]|uniref:LysE family translocator n=1 Tax=Phytopseudomonas daroniae TaxID=2487519 RepID=UPI001038390E|nr:LysE family translocator [Pseudomonas daroniae]TBU77401.1 lysine transporter LysE [Pseudomonas daroniae]